MRIFNNYCVVCGNICTNLFHGKSRRSFTFIYIFWVFFIAGIRFNIFIIYMISLFMNDFHANCRHIFIYLRLSLYIYMMVLCIRYIWLYSILVTQSSDVEIIPVQNLSRVKASQSITGT